MRRLDVVAAAAGSDGDRAGDAGAVARRHAPQQRHRGPQRRGAAARRHRGPVPRTLVPARYAAPHVVDPDHVEIPLPPLCVRPVLVAAVADQVPAVEVRLQPVHARICGPAVRRAEHEDSRLPGVCGAQVPADLVVAQRPVDLVILRDVLGLLL